MHRKFLPTFLLLSLSFALSAQIYVKHDATGANDGSSWENAYTDLSMALQAASLNDQIWVAAGTYKPGSGTPDSTSNFSITKPLQLLGGFAGTESSADERDPQTNLTILSGDINGDDQQLVFDQFRDDNTQHVVYVDSLLSSMGPVVIDGFTIMGGHTSDFNDQDEWFWRGGGILAYSTTFVSNCNFEGNFARSGGSIYLGPGADDSAVDDCRFAFNNASSQSAGIFANSINGLKVRNCTFELNVTARGCLYPLRCQDVLIESCTFRGNANADGFGAGAFFWNNRLVKVDDCLFENNSAANAAGFYYDGRELEPNPLDFVLTNSTFVGNSATGFGGGGFYMWDASMTMDNCLFDANSSSNSGAHLFASCAGDSVIFKNCTFENGNAGGWGGAHTAYGLDAQFYIQDCEYLNNTAVQLGGAVNNGFVANVTYDNCLFSGNVSTSSAGGALSIQNDSTAVTVYNCLFSSNTSSSSGGALFGGAGSNHFFVDECVFEGNEAMGFGGAIHINESGDDDIASLMLSNSIFLFNLAADQGGAVNLIDADATIYNCLFAFNNATGEGRGGAISNNVTDSSTVNLSIINCTVANNIGGFSAGLIQWTENDVDAIANTTIQNTILANDGLINYAIEAGSPMLISNGGNLSDDLSTMDYFTHAKDQNATDPLFVNPDDFDFHLQAGSPAIDAGVSENAPEFDLDGNPRVGEVDAGAYEFQEPSAVGEELLENTGLLTLAPNPVRQSATFRLNNDWRGPVQFRFVNVMGQVVKVVNAEKSDDLLELRLHLPELGLGLYDVIASNGRQALVVKMAKL
ncbi:MAG: hypothetical protein D6765_12590 [Bacteroidetes bacterium]|nr:MAG: hypothetical protein D6765_12590 [Bacteroidota bacterium]